MSSTDHRASSSSAQMITVNTNGDLVGEGLKRKLLDVEAGSSLTSSLAEEPWDLSVLEEKLDPSIYSFHSEKLNAKLAPLGIKPSKIGYTSRRPAVRVEEWRRKAGYEDIVANYDFPACFTTEAGEKVYYDDRAIHTYLKNHEHIKLVDFLSTSEVDISGMPYVSSEFFFEWNTDFGVRQETVEAARDDIIARFGDPASPYRYYTEPSGGRQVVETHYAVKDFFAPRAYQTEAIQQIQEMILRLNLEEAEEKKVLLFSPTRTGKSYMAAWAAKAIFEHYANTSAKKNHCAVIVSGKVDVFDEHQRTYEAHADFGEVNSVTGKKPFKVLRRHHLDSAVERGVNAIEEAYSEADNVVVIVSLQDLARSTGQEGAKPRHNQLVGKVDLVIADEAHFAMFGNAERYKAALQAEATVTKEVKKGRGEKSTTELEATVNEDLLEEISEDGASEEEIQVFQSLNPRYGTLYCTATPFEILMTPELGFVVPEVHRGVPGNVVVVDPLTIEKESAQWIEENPEEPEWKSPYFGIPLTYSYGINVGQPSLIFGVSGSNAKELLNHSRAKEIFRAMFGQREDSHVPSFFNDENFLRTGGGKSIVMALPRKRSCDLVEEILEELGVAENFQVMNISASKCAKDQTYAKMSAQQLKKAIEESERPTIVLTVGRMLTGASVPQWDTICLMFNGDSMQFRLQAMGRPNTPFVRTLEDDKGDKIRVVEKPYTHVIDFAPGKLYEVRERADAIFERLASQRTGKSETRSDTLSGGPIFDCSSRRLTPMTATDVRARAFESLVKRSLSDLAKSTPLNFGALWDDPDSQALIEASSVKLEGSKFATTTLDPETHAEGKCVDCRVNDVRPPLAGMPQPTLCEECEKKRSKKLKGKPDSATESETSPDGALPKEDDESSATLDLDLGMSEKERKAQEAKWKERIYGNLTLVLLYSILTEEFEQTLTAVISSVEEGGLNAELARRLGLDVDFLKTLIRTGVVGTEFDQKIFAVNTMMADAALPVMDRLQLAMNGLDSFSSNEVRTPDHVVNLILDKLQLTDEDYLAFAKGDGRGLIDPGCKTATFLAAFMARLNVAFSRLVQEGKLDDSEAQDLLERVKREKLWAIPTSGISYEVILRVYRDSGWNTDQILWNSSIADEDGWLGANWAYAVTSSKLASKLDKIEDTTVREEFRKWVELNTSDEEKFDYCISNPPYQDSGLDGKKIYPAFFLASVKLAKRSVMVFPRGWRTARGRGHIYEANEMKALPGIVSIDEYTEDKDAPIRLFSAGTGGVTIVVYDVGHQDSDEVIFSRNGEAPKSLSKALVYAESKEMLSGDLLELSTRLINTYGSVMKRISTQTRYGVRVKAQLKDEEFIRNYISLEPVKGYLRIYNNDGLDRWISPKAEGLKPSKNHKLAFPSTGTQRQHRDSFVLGPDDVTSDTYITVEFPTREEVENYRAYLGSAFYSFFLSLGTVSHNGTRSTHQFVPDIQNFTAKHALFMPDSNLPEGHPYLGLSLDERLHRHFNLSSEEIALLERDQ